MNIGSNRVLYNNVKCFHYSSVSEAEVWKLLNIRKVIGKVNVGEKEVEPLWFKTNALLRSLLDHHPQIVEMSFIYFCFNYSWITINVHVEISLGLKYFEL